MGRGMKCRIMIGKRPNDRRKALELSVAYTPLLWDPSIMNHWEACYRLRMALEISLAWILLLGSGTGNWLVEINLRWPYACIILLFLNTHYVTDILRFLRSRGIHVDIILPSRRSCNLEGDKRWRS